MTRFTSLNRYSDLVALMMALLLMLVLMARTDSPPASFGDQARLEFRASA